MRSLLTVALLLCAKSVLADDAQNRVRARADEIEAAWNAGDEEKIKKFAGVGSPDRWLVAEELCIRGKLMAATAFARATPSPLRARLQAYLTNCDGERAGRLQAAMAQARAANEAGDPERALELLREYRGPPKTVSSILVCFIRAIAHQRLGRFRESSSELRAAAVAARGLGWWVQAGNAFREAAKRDTDRKDLKAARDACEQAEAIYREFGPPGLLASTLYLLARFDIDEASFDQAEARLKEARALQDAGCICPPDDKILVAWAFAYLYERTGRPAEALPHFLRALEMCGETVDYRYALNLQLGAGRAQQNLGRYEQARSLFEGALRTSEEHANQRGLADALERLGDLAGVQGDWPRSQTLLRRSLELNRQLGRPVASVLVKLSNAVRQTTGSSASLDLCREALEDAQRRGNAMWTSIALTGIGEDLRNLGRPREALEHLKRARAGMETLGEMAELPGTLLSIGNCHLVLGELDAAREAYEAGLEPVRKMGKLSVEASFHQGLSAVHSSQGEHVEAIACLERALDIAEKIGDLNAAANALVGLGAELNSIGDPQRAKSSTEQGLDLFRNGQDSVGEMEGLLTLGSIHQSLGRLPEALEALDAAASSAEQLGLEQKLAQALAASAGVLGEQGRFSDALRNLAQAREIHERIDDPQGKIYLLCEAANLNWRLGEASVALTCYEDGLSSARACGLSGRIPWFLHKIAYLRMSQGEAEAALGPIGEIEALCDGPGKSRILGQCLDLRSRVLQDLGRLEAALAPAERALSIARENSDVGMEFRGLLRLANLHINLNELDAAERLQEEASLLCDSLGSPPKVVQLRRQRAQLLLARNKPRAAAIEVRAAIEDLARFAGGLSDQESMALRQKYAVTAEVGVLAGLGMDSATETNYFLETGRALAFLESLDGLETLERAVLPSGLQAALTQARAAESAASTQLEAARRTGLRTRVREASQALSTARTRAQSVAHRVQREIKAQAELIYPRADEAPDIQGRLGPHEAFVSYGVLTREGDPALAVVIGPAELRVVPLGEARAIRSAVGALDLSVPGSEHSEAVADLRRLLWAPLELKPDVRRVYISPDVELAMMPFSLLADGREIVFTPSGTVHGALQSAGSLKGEFVLALGDPTYGAQLPPGVLRSVTRADSLVPLPATRAEAEALGDIVLTGPKASESELRRHLARPDRWRAVHLACHGFLNQDRPAFSSLALSPDTANDGFLTCLELLGMRVSADLVVLSACETGRGTVYRGEGLMGLTRALMIAGTPRVVCSLWKVEDRATQELMIKFYELWDPESGAGLAAATALRKAQEFMRTHPEHPEWRDPFYWAGWVQWGLP